MNFRLALKIWLTVAALAATAVPAFAHPHVLVSGKSELVFSPDGKITAVKHAWTFDEAFSVFATQGLDKNSDGVFSREELAELAQVNVTSLKEFEYFTAGKSGADKISFGEPENYWLEYKDKLLTLFFTLPVKNSGGKGETSFNVFDPTYFVAFSLAEDNPVKLAGAPQNCSLKVERPAPLTSQTPLSESFFNSLTAASEYGSQFANRIIVTCR